MKKGGGKDKGSSFEREIARKLSLWWTDGVRDDVFYRSQSSGARFTNRAKSKKDTAYQSGDITFSDPIGEPLCKKFSFELKTGYGTWDLLEMIDSHNKQPMLIAFWDQCKEDATKSGKEPILIFKRNRKVPCICFSTAVYLKFVNWFGKMDNLIEIIYNKDKVVIMSLSAFLDWSISIHGFCEDEK